MTADTAVNQVIGMSMVFLQSPELLEAVCSKEKSFKLIPLRMVEETSTLLQGQDVCRFALQCAQRCMCPNRT